MILFLAELQRHNVHSLPPFSESKPSFDLEGALKKMKVAELKELCKDKGISTSGKKADLIARLIDVQNSAAPVSTNKAEVIKDDLDDMSVEDLRDALVGRGLDPEGSREEVLARLRQDIKLVVEMQEDNPPTGRDSYIALSHMLEQRAKDVVPTIPKFINVKITSLGLVPEKFTVGGAPSVTADVIRKLAGDPFADPPKYGTVCIIHRAFLSINHCCASVLTIFHIFVGI